MSRIHPDVSARPDSRLSRGLDWAMRIVPATALVAIAAFFTAQQVVQPHHRAIKVLVLLALMALMFRFDMVYSVYLFTLLFVFPSGISYGSTNAVLMTLIPLIWAVRATSSRTPLLLRTPLDAPIAVFLLTFVVALGNVNDGRMLIHSIAAIWVQVAACAFCYTITMFVNDEDKLLRLCKVICISCALVMLTAVVELIAPGRSIIPGWIGLARNLGEGQLTYRIQGLRVGGAFESHDMLSDFGSQIFLFMVFFMIVSRNIITRAVWMFAAGLTLIAILGTANRGGMVGFTLGLTMGLVYFRRKIGTARVLALAAVAITGVYFLDAYLSENTVAVSVFERFANTEFEGIVPENRTMTWKPTLMLALEKPFFGHGPYFSTGTGLSFLYWPHNGYLYFFYTLGLAGLTAFTWVLWRVFQQTRLWRHPAVRNTRLGAIMALTQVWFFVLLVEQLRTDHQRDDIYPFIVWMCFGVANASAAIARRRIAATG